jgi:hypothetical protein
MRAVSQPLRPGVANHPRIDTRLRPRRGVSPRQRVSQLFYDVAMSNAAKPLGDQRVRNITDTLSLRYCTKVMVTHGASIVKVEEEGHVSPARPAWRGGQRDEIMVRL